MAISREEFIKRTTPPSVTLGADLTRKGYSWVAVLIGPIGEPCLNLESARDIDIEVYFQSENGVRNLVGHYRTFREFVDEVVQ